MRVILPTAQLGKKTNLLAARVYPHLNAKERDFFAEALCDPVTMAIEEVPGTTCRASMRSGDYLFFPKSKRKTVILDGVPSFI